ncbi:hypothetical protein [Pedosphaera parvula]|uniref:Uncharacterized protein n=1 Tax=Pedosphaera parvula (strain Ellin514) TaxID=320771 RepID=B9XCL3_PEDPL|nr:hypothetical protein [Pedosphaera parvula]EEF62681.1 hypothetical protein Cflav_PD5316 [Pedosphaera parvula Ellin514]
MFNLEQEIKKWRRQLAAGGIKSSAALEELECHLREDIQRQMQSGVGAQPAFEDAVRRIGKVETLKEEFMKIKRTEAQQRRLARISLIIGGMVYLLGGIFGLLKSDLGSTERLLGFAAVIFSLLSLGSGRYLSRFLPVLTSDRARIKVQFACALPAVAWVFVYFYVILPHCNLTLGEVVVATLWGIAPLAIVGGITNGMDEAAYISTHSAS